MTAPHSHTDTGHDETDRARLLAYARGMQAAGLHLMPPKGNGSKSPVGDLTTERWKQFQTRPLTEGEFQAFFVKTKRTGLGCITGTKKTIVIEGHATECYHEVLDFDARNVYVSWVEAANACGCGDITRRIEAGWLDYSPRGGHLHYWTPVGESSQALAQYLNEEGHPKALIETRGIGGYIVTAPSWGTVHNSGKPYTRISGGPQSMTIVTGEEREALFRIARSFDRIPPKEETAYREPHGDRTGVGTRPGDLFAARTDWRDILAPHGWVFLFTSREGVSFWRRPGKDRGVSATTNYANSGYLYVFSTSTAFEANRGYGKFSAYAFLNHDGNFSAAAEDLRRQGFCENNTHDSEAHDGAADNERAEEASENSTEGSRPSNKEPPRPLRRQVPDPSPYPVEKLLALTPVVKRLHDTIQAPLSLCGQSVLAAVSLAVQGHADIHIDGRVIPLSLDCITIGETGERKTAVDREVLRPHRAHEKTLADAYDAHWQDYENDLAAYKRARDDALKKAKTRAEKKAALESVGSAPQAPLLPVLLTEEPTYEGLIKLLQHGQPSLGLFADEAGRFIGGYGMSEEHQLKTASGLSELWDSKRISRVRGGDGAALLYGRRVAMHLMAQPDVALRVLSNSLLLNQGLLSRCLVTWPHSTAGTRSYKEINLRNDPAIQAYDHQITKILRSPLPLAQEKQNELAPRELSLGKEAKRLWIKFHDAVEGRLGDGQPFAVIRGFANKAAEHALRIAGTLALYSDLTAKAVSTAAMQAGIDLTQYYLDEAVRLFNAGQTDPDLVLAEKLLIWAQQRQETDVALVDIYQRGLNAISDAATARRLVKILEAHGWFIPVPGGKEIDGQFRREVWKIVQEEKG